MPEAFRDHALGDVIGHAVGDALGMSLEFETPDAEPPVTDRVGDGPLRFKPKLPFRPSICRAFRQTSHPRALDNTPILLNECRIL